MALPDGKFAAEEVSGEPIERTLQPQHVGWYVQSGPIGERSGPLDYAGLSTDRVIAQIEGETEDDTESAGVGDTLVIAGTAENDSGGDARTLSLSQRTVYGFAIVDGITDGEAGEAARPWTVEPDYSEAPVEAFVWRTQVSRHKDGTEYRAVTLGDARRELGFRVTTDNVPRVDRALTGWQSGRWTVPRYPDVHLTTAAVAVGDTRIPTDTSHGEWRVGYLVRIGDETRTLIGVRPDGIDIDSGCRRSHPVRTRVYPERVMLAAASSQRGVITAGVTRGRVGFVADQDIGIGYAGRDEPTIDDIPVYWREPNADGAQVQYTRDAARIDSGHGPIFIDDPEGDPYYAHDWSYVLKRGEAVEFLRFLKARTGRFNVFLYPTWNTDAKLVTPVSAGDKTLTIERIDWDRWYQGRANRERIALRTSAGWHTAIVTGNTVSGDTETLTLDRAIEADIPTSALVSWLEQVRLAGDRIELAWPTAGLAQATLQLQSVK